MASESQLQGRTVECAQLARLVANARAGSSGALVIRGEAGIGKSALLGSVFSGASGCAIARAAGVESEMEFAFAGLHQVCVPFLDHVDRLPAPQADALRTAFGLHAGPPPDPFLVGLAALTLFSIVAETRPFVCLIDDMQWLDQASRQVLGFVARRLAQEAVVMIFAVRDDGGALDLAGIDELSVGPVGDDDARAILVSAIAGKVDASVRDRVVAEARGNPLALLELPRAWTPAALAGGFGLPDAVSVSSRIEESFRRRLNPLPDESKSLLLVAAAESIGDPILIARAAERLEIPMAAAEPAVAAGLLEVGAGVVFRHPLVRSVVYREAPIGDRRRAHQALADSTDATSDPDRRIWHLAAAAAGPDEAVATQLEQSAGRAQARGGRAAAAAFLQRAVALTGDEALRAGRALSAAQASLQAGEFEAARGLLDTAEAGELVEFQRAMVDLTRGHVAFASGMGVDAPPLLLKAATGLQAYAPDLASETYLTAWAGAVAAGHVQGTTLLFEICHAVQADRPPDERPVDLLITALARLTTDGHAAAAPMLERAAAAMAEIPVEDVLRWGWAAAGPSTALWDDEGVLTITSRSVQLVRDAGVIAQLPIQLSALAVAVAGNGDLTEAATHIAESDSVAAATGSQIAPYALLRLQALRGRPQEASPLIAATIAYGQPHGHWASAVLDNGLGRYDQAADAASQAAACTYDPWVSSWALPELVEAASRTGKTELALDAVERLAAATLPGGRDWGLGLEARSRALVSVGGVAEDHYREAIARLARSRLRPELARGHLMFGEWLRREGRRVDAREQLRSAHQLFEAIGMEAFAERARRELLATGETVRKRSVDTQDALTPQELQIGRLAGDGRTNQEIGGELFLSPRTVEWHLRKVYTKLGVDSRRELRTALPATGTTVAV